MIPFREVNVLDINAAHLGVPTSQLMENAGKGTADVALERFEIKGGKVVIICGPGNNGGDGFVAARYLEEVCNVTVILVKSEEHIRTAVAKDNFQKIKDRVDITDISGIAEKILGANLVIDAMLGIGVSGRIREPYLSCVKSVNTASIPILSVDVASGLGSEDAICPTMTVTFHDVKEGMDRSNSGEIVVVDIGIPDEAQRFLGPGEFAYYPRPAADSHKGDNGRLLIIGGGPYTGAPALAGLAAYRMGVDLVHIATPSKTYEVIASYSPNFIVHRLGGDVFSEDDIGVIKPLLDKTDAVIIGPGLGSARETGEAVLSFIKQCTKPLAIDADAITPLAGHLDVLKGHGGVITPHANEFTRLTGEQAAPGHDDQAGQVAALAQRTGFTVLLKGATDVIGNGTHVKFNKTGNPAMTVGGTGDVLVGLAGGMIAKGASPFAAARIAAFVCGSAGDLAFEEIGYSLMATDLIDKVPIVLRSFLR